MKFKIKTNSDEFGIFYTIQYKEGFFSFWKGFSLDDYMENEILSMYLNYDGVRISAGNEISFRDLRIANEVLEICKRIFF